MPKHIIVAIDGPAGAGKSTIARRIAGRLGYLYIDSGAMYRAIALWALRLNVALDDVHRLEQLAQSAEIELRHDGNVLLDGEDVSAAIRAPDVSAGASRVAAIGAVRRALVEKQRAIGRTHSVVMEGRDIGTVVFPEAHVKIYLDANPEIRANRRAEELRGKGLTVDAERVRDDIHERDQRDQSRQDSPLAQAPDAFLVDSSGLTPDEVEETILRIVRERTSNGKEVQR